MRLRELWRQIFFRAASRQRRTMAAGGTGGGGQGPRRLAFENDETVLCYHGPQLYEAKVLRSEYWEARDNQEEGPHYLVHYKGWKSKYAGGMRALSFDRDRADADDGPYP